jgi:multiple sugar transport system ATP-binding protein
MASVSLQNVAKSFGDVEVLHDINLQIDDGEFVVLVGPSGCGKSTLLRIVAGLEDTIGGAIRIGDTIVNFVPPRDRSIAMVFQDYALYPSMTAFDNMAFSLRLARAPAAEIEAKVRQAAEALGLSGLLDRLPRQLSGGQRQRVAMGRAIVRDPKVFLFDEPLSNLDAQLRVQTRTEIRALQQRLGTTTIYVTHDQIEAMTMADRLVVMNAGRIEQVGNPLDVYDRPANLFVARFIGSPAINLLKGIVQVREGRKICLTSDAIELPIPDRFDVESGRAVVYGVRPEHLQPSADGVDCLVNVVEPTGSSTLVFCQLGDWEVCTETYARTDILRGQAIRLMPMIEHTHLFDQASGMRIPDHAGH